MSWQVYVDQNMVGTGKITRGAIIGLKGGGIWAKSAGYNITAAEAKGLVAGFQKPDELQGSGIRLAGTKFMTIQVDADHAYGKKGPGGVACYKTEQAILVGEYGEGIQAGDANQVVGGLADYLKGVGY